MRALILGFASMAAVGVYQAPAVLLAQERPPIIDMHLHADLPPHDIPPGTPALCRPEPCQGTGRATANDADTLRKSLEAMDRYNIVKAFLSGVDPAVVQQWVSGRDDRDDDPVSRLHGDVSTISWVLPRAAFYDYLQALVRAGLGKRVMFGSDQMRWPEKIGEAIEAIESM